ncbi:MAG: DUF29 family protein [Proteobacteria bacterium]|nr:DUF29 family protein [Pseudomonadota bacterium]
MNNSSLYNHDFYAWAVQTSKLLRQGKFKEIDVEHIAEEIAILNAARQTGLESSIFPKKCIYSLDQCLNDPFYPE